MSSDEAKLVATMKTQIAGLKSLDSVKDLQEALRTVGREIREKENPKKEGETPGGKNEKAERPDVSENIEKKVYVTGVHTDTTLDKLKEYIGGAGAIAFAKWTYKGFKMRKASIEFEKEESVKASIDKFNQTKLEDSELTVAKFELREKKERKPRAESAKPKATKNEESKREPKSRAASQSAKTAEPKREPRARAAPKEYAVKEEAKAAQEGGVYIGNLAYAVDDKTFSDFVYGFGKIKEQYIQKDSRGRSKGYGIVVFRYPKDAEKCIQELNGLELEGRKVFARADKGDTTEGSYTKNEGSGLRGGARGARSGDRRK